jgi:hypothetical protein
MRLLLVCGLVVAAVYGVAAAQEQTTIHAPDGGSWVHVQSIDVPATANAPFSATVTTEVSKILADGSTETNWNHRLIARDTSGRVFEERRMFSPTGNNQTTPLNETDYVDPNRHERFACRPLQRVCYESTFFAPAKVNTGPAGPVADGRGTVTREALGQKTIEDVDVIGSREITTLNAGVVGNQKAEPIVKEFWYSPRLEINIITKRFDPRFGAQNFIVSNINQSEPDPKMFEPPVDFRVIKMTAQ